MSNAPGIDVSHYQGNVDWTAVRGAGMVLAFAKATEGSSYVDSKFAANWAGMKTVGLKRGAYHFFDAGSDPTAQARHFLQTVGTIDADDLAPVLDVESGGGIPTQASVQAWLDTVELATDNVPIIYTSPSFAEEYLGDGFGRYPLWEAEYGVSEPRIPRGWSTWTFWQYSQTGSVAGVQGDVDLDWHNGPLDSKYEEYAVQSGDTLNSIAARFGTTVDAIAELNGIGDPNLIEIEQVIKIP